VPEDSSISITTEQQVVEWEKIQDDFLTKVGTSSPTNPTAQENWISAQQESDDLFRAKFGTEAFLRQNIESYRQGLTQK
jgi:hypothetical protein